MKKYICRITSRLTLLIMVGTVLILSSCTPSNGEGFAIYLTEGDIPPDRMPTLSHIEIAEHPIVAINDIVTYNAQTHEIKLTANAFERISELEVPVRGKSFVVCVDRSPIYWGAFWTPISSISFDGIVIIKPLGSEEPKVIKLEQGYPSPAFSRNKDPRNKAEVMQSLESTGKLVNKPSVTATGQLPHSMKGYELYSWLEEGQWHFTLVTGTNRNKTLEEIVSHVNIISEDGWVQINVAGADAIITVLSRLPQNEQISWLAGLRSEQMPQDNLSIMLPPAPILDTIKEHTSRCSLVLQIQPAS